MYQVWKINDRNVYEKVAETANVTCAVAIKKYLMRQGEYAQICKKGEMPGRLPGYEHIQNRLQNR